MFNQQLSKEELIQLGQFLEQQQIKDPDSMDLTELHGFLSAILTGPTTIMPSQWHPFAFGEEGLEFESEEQALMILPMFSQLNNHIIYQLEGDRVCEPLIYQANQIVPYKKISKESLQSWCSAYLEGTRLDDSWMKEQTAVENLFPIGVLAEEFSLIGELDSSGEKISNDSSHKEEFRLLLPQIIFNLYQFWKGKRFSGFDSEDFKPIESMRYNTPKVGRNDLCPCGSNKKYKKCCLN